jgi:hypothetical protein
MKERHVDKSSEALDETVTDKDLVENGPRYGSEQDKVGAQNVEANSRNDQDKLKHCPDHVELGKVCIAYEELGR